MQTDLQTWWVLPWVLQIDLQNDPFFIFKSARYAGVLHFLILRFAKVRVATLGFANRFACTRVATTPLGK